MPIKTRLSQSGVVKIFIKNINKRLLEETKDQKEENVSKNKSVKTK
uniref:Uncharacterized protein n=1 Tax=Romanomermis culicivorax TaxID=13658 RepID=A0A915JTV4_ROMCU